MFKRLIITVALTISASSVFAAQYIKPDDLKRSMDQKKSVVIVDIQTADDFTKHHLDSSLETNAYPVKSPEDKKRLDQAITTINSSASPVVIVCPRGKGGAMNTYEYLKTKGVPEGRLFILEGGMAGWPYKEVVRQGR